MIKFEIDDSAVRARLDAMPEKIRKEVYIATISLAEQLRTYILKSKLSGQVLNHRTGQLWQSIQQHVEQTAQEIYGIVYSAGNVKYAAIHEYGGQIPAHEIRAKNGALAFMWKGSMVYYKKVNHPGSRMPERSFMRSSLADMKDDIERRYMLAVERGIQ